MGDGQPGYRPTGLLARAGRRIAELAALQSVARPALAAALMLMVSIAGAESARVTPGHQIQFPRDGGSHPEFDTEWWYVTGWVEDGGGTRRGFQVTFFRSRNEGAAANPSKFAATQLLFAHAAVSDASHGKLLHAQRSARAGFGLAEADENATNVHIDDWSLRTRGEHFSTQVSAPEFSFTLDLKHTQPPLLQGENGFSQKGPDPRAASYYYSLPHLEVSGSLRIGSETHVVRGKAWFDHEWFSEYVSQDATGWDWVGINLEDGGALMAFRIRDPDAGEYWAGGTVRVDDRRRHFTPEQVTWTPMRTWQSPRTGVRYPVERRLQVGELQLRLRPLFDDQENDTRATVGVLYWEGAIEALNDRGEVVGRGYLELTGYDRPLRM